jgi:hypothetical protein
MEDRENIKKKRKKNLSDSEEEEKTAPVSKKQDTLVVKKEKKPAPLPKKAGTASSSDSEDEPKKASPKKKLGAVMVSKSKPDIVSDSDEEPIKISLQKKTTGNKPVEPTDRKKPGEPTKQDKTLKKPGEPTKQDKTLKKPGEPTKPDKTLKKPGEPAKQDKTLKKPGEPTKPDKTLKKPGESTKQDKTLKKPGEPTKQDKTLKPKSKSFLSRKTLVSMKGDAAETYPTVFVDEQDPTALRLECGGKTFVVDRELMVEHSGFIRATLSGPDAQCASFSISLPEGVRMLDLATLLYMYHNPGKAGKQVPTGRQPLRLIRWWKLFSYLGMDASALENSISGVPLDHLSACECAQAIWAQSKIDPGSKLFAWCVAKLSENINHYLDPTSVKLTAFHLPPKTFTRSFLVGCMHRWARKTWIGQNPWTTNEDKKTCVEGVRAAVAEFNAEWELEEEEAELKWALNESKETSGNARPLTDSEAAPAQEDVMPTLVTPMDAPDAGEGLSEGPLFHFWREKDHYTVGPACLRTALPSLYQTCQTLKGSHFRLQVHPRVGSGTVKFFFDKMKQPLLALPGTTAQLMELRLLMSTVGYPLETIDKHILARGNSLTEPKAEALDGWAPSTRKHRSLFKDDNLFKSKGVQITKSKALWAYAKPEHVRFRLWCAAQMVGGLDEGLRDNGTDSIPRRRAIRSLSSMPLWVMPAVAALLYLQAECKDKDRTMVRLETCYQRFLEGLEKATQTKSSKALKCAPHETWVDLPDEDELNDS